MEQQEQKIKAADEKFCSDCGEIIKVRAEICPSCGVRQKIQSGLVQIKHGTFWLPLPSMIIGIICILALFDESEWDEDLLIGMFVMAAFSLTLGIVSVSIQEKGKGMAIAGIVLSVLALLAGIGLAID